jgi:hypothetical protein
MIQSETFNRSREIARLPFGRDGRAHFSHVGDVSHQWDACRTGSKILEMIGRFSVEPERVPVLREVIGQLSPEEIVLRNDMSGFFADVARLMTSLPTALDMEPDILETILDFRVLRDHVKFPCRVLDIGPGIGRHSAALFSSSFPAGSSYVGIESIEAPYELQNIAGNLLSVRNPSISFADYIDYQSARKALMLPPELPKNSIFHLPLWADGLLPSNAFDLIICNYILDEVSAADLDRITAIMGRCLAKEGVVYCRGSQQKSMIKDLYLFGYGTFHQQDITRKLLARNLRTKDVRLVADTLTRLLVREDSQSHAKASGPVASLKEDSLLIEALQQGFVHDRIEELKTFRTPTLIWMDPDHQDFVEKLLPELKGVNLCGITSDHVHQSGPGPFGLKQFSLSEVPGLHPGAFVIAGRRIKLAHRELCDAFGRSLPIRWFNYPVAFVYAGE